MILLIKMKNATSSPHAWVGQEIQPGEYYTIQPEEKENWENDTNVLYSIELGELVVNDGTNDLTPEDGKRRLQAETEAQKILFQSSNFQSKDSYNAIIEASQKCTGLIGLCYQANFSMSGELLIDSYLTRETEATFFQLPFDSLCRAMIYNCKSQADFDINIYNQINGRELLVFSHIARGSWTGSITKIDEISFSAGSLIRTFVKRAGRNPIDLTIDLLFQSISNKKLNFTGGY